MADVGQWMAWHGMCRPVDGMALHVWFSGWHGMTCVGQWIAWHGMFGSVDGMAWHVWAS